MIDERGGSVRTIQALVIESSFAEEQGGVMLHSVPRARIWQSAVLVLAVFWTGIGLTTAREVHARGKLIHLERRIASRLLGPGPHGQLPPGIAPSTIGVRSVQSPLGFA